MISMLVSPEELAGVLTRCGESQAGAFWARAASRRLRERFHSVSESFPGLVWVAVEAALLAGWKLHDDPALPHRLYASARSEWEHLVSTSVEAEEGRAPRRSPQGDRPPAGQRPGGRWRPPPSHV